MPQSPNRIGNKPPKLVFVGSSPTWGVKTIAYKHLKRRGKNGWEIQNTI